MKDLLRWFAVVFLVILALRGFWTYARPWIYSFAYEDMVRETVRKEMMERATSEPLPKHPAFKFRTGTLIADTVIAYEFKRRQR